MPFLDALMNLQDFLCDTIFFSDRHCDLVKKQGCHGNCSGQPFLSHFVPGKLFLLTHCLSHLTSHFRVECTGKTGVEMEALMGASIALLTVYDMCKAVSKDMVITDVHLVTKTGGKTEYKKT